jgi:hypothetical protein
VTWIADLIIICPNLFGCSDRFKIAQGNLDLCEMVHIRPRRFTVAMLTRFTGMALTQVPGVFEGN